MKEKRTLIIKLLILICFFIIILVSIILFGISYHNKIHRFDSIQISYDYGHFINFSGTNQEHYAITINLHGRQLSELQNILNKYNFESNKYKIEDTGHYHGLTFYTSVMVIPAEYKVTFNDGSEMVISEDDYQIQYRNGNNYYLINDGEKISQKIIEIVDKRLHNEI